MAIRNLETLGDAARARLQLFANCRNYLCRHRWLVDIEHVMCHVGAAHFLEPVRGRRHFSELMKCPECGYVGVTIEHGERLDHRPTLEGLGVSIEEWDDRDRQMTSLIARCRNILVGWAAYEKVLELYPRRRIKMREGAHLVVDSRMRVIKGGKE